MGKGVWGTWVERVYATCVSVRPPPCSAGRVKHPHKKTTITTITHRCRRRPRPSPRTRPAPCSQPGGPARCACMCIVGVVVRGGRIYDGSGQVRRRIKCTHAFRTDRHREGREGPSPAPSIHSHTHTYTHAYPHIYIHAPHGRQARLPVVGLLLPGAADDHHVEPLQAIHGRHVGLQNLGRHG